MSGYELSRQWFTYCLDNPDRVKPIHTALYFWIVETFNRFDWKSKVGLPTDHAMEVLGIKSYKTYGHTLNDLVEFGFVEMVEKSRNQYSSNIVALVKNTKATTKARPEHTPKHDPKQGRGTASITKPINQEPKNQETLEGRKLKFADTLKPYVDKYGRPMINDFYKYWTEPNKSKSKFRQELQKTWDLERRLETWSRNDNNFKKTSDGNKSTGSVHTNR